MTDLSAADAPPPGALARLLRRKMALFGLAIIAVVVAGAVFARWVAPFDPNDQMFDGLTLEGAPMPPDGQVPGWGPTCWAATCSAGCCMARRPR
jgi:peptide/nickel transport system permease protein